MSSIRYPSLNEFWPAIRARNFVKALGFPATNYAKNMAILARKAGVHPAQMSKVNPLTFAGRNGICVSSILGSRENFMLELERTQQWGSSKWAYALWQPIPAYEAGPLPPLTLTHLPMHEPEDGEMAPRPAMTEAEELHAAMAGLLALEEVGATYDERLEEYTNSLPSTHCRKLTLPVGITLEELKAMTPDELDAANERGLADASEAEWLFQQAQSGRLTKATTFVLYKKAAALGHTQSKQIILNAEGDVMMGY